MCQQVKSPTGFIGRKCWTCVRLVWSTHYGNAGCEEFSKWIKNWKYFGLIPSQNVSRFPLILFTFILGPV